MTKKTDIRAYYDHQRRTCIQVERSEEYVKFVPLDIDAGLDVCETSTESFDLRYKPMVNYPPEKACQLYLGYSQSVGATPEVLDYLGHLIKITEQEYDMATKKKSAPKETTKKVVTPKAVKASPKVEKKAAPAKKGASQASVAPEAKGERKPSAAGLFKDLIMAGKMTDAEIFAEVQAAFGLDDKKRGYVQWYRNHLRTKGMNPPDAKPEKV